jgi:uncharacterized protein
MSNVQTPQTLRRALRAARLTAACLLVAACVTINVYFPAAAAEKAADQIIDAVTGGIQQGGGGGRAPTAPPATQPPLTRVGPVAGEMLAATLGRVLYALVPAAHAQEANLDISSAEIRALTASMSGRFGQLQKYFDAGVIGMTQNGMIEVRDANAAALPERAVVSRLVAEDNRDREALYTEIAKANGHPEWAGDIRKTFARRWVERGARAGWYYQNASGSWVQK